ncbi:PQQ-dependent sugar dehydrogenase [Nereida sp. MMG025]|uniref:PQQ-dependent sugar dehydrogenase n=1 Tax=Nereida sp. MMG025 TaxID=2909981 RepID=UPI001F3510B7|nr:PQQ-dependent sugar dehydrogenase [Nereida sp. MMG025]MCF6443323.1 PQQ-dependent sugar dehydrogenase [Nereida sp. MMG025]
MRWITTGAAILWTQAAAALTFTPVVTGLDTPWAVEELPSGAFLVTERDGRLLHIADGTAQNVRGVPQVSANGQGGLLDVTLPRDFAQTREVFLTYAKPQGRGEGTALAVGTLSADGTRLRNVRDLFVAKAGSRGGRHFGSRVVEGPDGMLYVTIGDRGDRPSAQDTTNHNGAIIRVTRAGRIPNDNPFVARDDVLPEIFSFGHRNPQGADFDANGTLWTAEHGARGGDEVNRIGAGNNYGWPVISYGRHYSGARIGEGTTQDGMEQPEFYWDPSIAPSGLLAYTGSAFPQWQGDLLVGSLKFDYIARLSTNPVREVEQIQTPQTSRVRDITQARDGSILFISVGNGTVYRLTP